jgi:selenium metabolism protein YedF
LYSISRFYIREFLIKEGTMKSKCILIQSEGLGRGDDRLGRLLIANFLRLLIEAENRPQKLVFWNSGVRLLCPGSPVLEHVKKLEGSGTEILACTTCLEYFDLKDKLVVGKPTTMLKSIESMLGGDFIAL